MQDLAQARLKETVEKLTGKVAASVDAVLSISDADLAEAIEAYSNVGMDGRLGTMAAEEDEDMFALRAALLCLHHLQLLTKVPADAPELYLSLHKLLQVCCQTCLFCLRRSDNSVWPCPLIACLPAFTHVVHNHCCLTLSCWVAGSSKSGELGIVISTQWTTIAHPASHVPTAGPGLLHNITCITFESACQAVASTTS